MTRIAIGDSIALGTGQALGCATDARERAPWRAAPHRLWRLAATL